MYKVEIIFWGEDKGGRISPPMPGYRPHVEIKDSYTSCIVNSSDNSITQFDFYIEYQVTLELVYPDQYSQAFESGDAIKLFEGSKQVAEGRVI